MHFCPPPMVSQYGSCHGISLISCTAKLFNRVLLNRICDPIEKLLRPNQNRFRKGRSKLEPILTLWRMIEAMSAKKDKKLCAIFVDFTKAFDSSQPWPCVSILLTYGIPSAVINAIRRVYTNSKSFVSTHNRETEAFAVNTGILQGDTLAPFLFIVVLDYALRQAMCNSELELHCNQHRDLDA